MGIPDAKCDDGSFLLQNDWYGTPNEYTCKGPPIRVRNDIQAIEECDAIPDNFSPQHYCMTDRIVFDHILPTHGDHRPLWAKFGEYSYVPPQRWSHNVEV